jgi:hypothetical protein
MPSSVGFLGVIIASSAWKKEGGQAFLRCIKGGILFTLLLVVV